MKKYGLRLRFPPVQKTSKPAPPRPPPPAFAFGGGDDEDDIEREISRQASKNKSLQKIEEQHKKAMEEDPSVFDYDGVYDEMKGKIARPKVQDRTERKSKYIETLVEKAKQREREHEIVYERKLLKERSKDDHLFADKEKFVTNAYKKKLAEQAKWLDEERLHQIREERDDVTKKSDLSDFYFGLGENVAFGAQSEDATKRKEQKPPGGTSAVPEHGPTEKNAQTDYTQDTEKDDTQAKTSSHTQNNSEQAAELTTSDVTVKDYDDGDKLAAVDQSTERYTRGDDALASARERFLTRKRARQQLESSCFVSI
ncbi:unnamed protein product [Musa acuminata subsp. malaccensis]|uniref:(wild Malaysian banana) hypothetical protein n=1 Tax=Musa acuminata subsp. malaccensis TaxID=214687 RepID=A0A8D6ZNR2_MUSAM|nr:unnamed protein product [Musa acuminata subsp. malaccensis]